jgi:mono/diheme cytochrome c family protein
MIVRGTPFVADDTIYVAQFGVGGRLIGVALVAVSLSGGQTPMSNTPDPVPDQVTSVDAGYDLYQANCAACHGVDGNGGGDPEDSRRFRRWSVRSERAESNDLRGCQPIFELSPAPRAV